MEKSNKVLVVVLVLVGLFVVSLMIAGISYLFGSKDYTAASSVAIIPVKGTIYSTSSTGFFATEAANSEDIVKMIEKAKKDPRIKAVVFEINSPGGSAVASDEIGTAIKELGKPTVAWIREYGASGGYWVASAADYIVANRMSMTGSIGVIGSFLEYPDLITRFNITYNRLVGGQYKDVGVPYRKLQPEEKDILQEKIDLIYDYFVEEVSNNRNISLEKTREMATGMVYLGSEAKDLGLVDELGGMKEVEGYLKKRLKLDKISFVSYEKKKTLLDVLMGVSNQFSFNLGRGFASSLIQEKPIIQI